MVYCLISPSILIRRPDIILLRSTKAPSRLYQRAIDMNRIDALFARKQKNILSVFCTAGYPQIDNTVDVLKSLQQNGVDMIELGIPYSDPLADGPTIQQSSVQAINNGMSITTLFGQLKNARREISIPLILMGYLNPVIQFGMEKFCEEAEKCGIDGLILPDLPEIEFQTKYKKLFDQHNLKFIFLVTPDTSADRILLLDQLSTGFLYAITSSSTTGSGKNMIDVEQYLERLNKMNLKNPVIAGFGISDKESFQSACKHAAGAIIGSAYIRALSSPTNIEETTRTFLSHING